MTVRFGVAGTGHWANIVHIPGLKAQPEVELVGVWGRSPAPLAEVSGRHGIKAFGRFEDMLKEVDAVSISMPPAVQVELACIAADAGKHLLLEKPIAQTVEGAEKIAAAASRNGISTVVFFTRRFVPDFEQSLQAASGRSWTGAKVTQHTDALLPRSPYERSVWRQQDNGALWDLAPHVLAALLAILGPIERVSAEHRPGRITVFTATHRGGAVSEVSLALHVDPAKTVSEYRLLTNGENYVLPLPTFERPKALSIAAGELAANIRKGERKHRCDVEFGLEVVRVLAAAERSIATGRQETV